MKLLLACLLLAASCFAQIDESNVVDLTWDFDEHTIYWPNAKPFVLQKTAWGPSPAGHWYAAANFSAAEHGGTHLDSPIHFSKDRQTTEEIALERLMGPAIVVDVTTKCAPDPDALVTGADLLAWEKANGRIPEKSIVLIRTGWGKFWPNKKKYLGSDKPGDTANLHFPGLAKDAAELLAARKVDGVGVDTASLDYGQSRDFIAHQVLNGANIYGLENVAHLERLPARGAYLIALPMKIKGGTGGPARIIAILP